MSQQESVVANRGPRKGSVGLLEDAAGYDALGWFTAEFPTVDTQTGIPRGFLVETRFDGTVQSAGCLGAVFEPGGDSLTVRLGQSARWSMGGQPFGQKSRLGSNLLAGLPVEYARGAFAGMIDTAMTLSLPSGRITVSAGAYDPIDSSPMSFKVTGGLLMWVICEHQSLADITGESISAQLAKWSGDAYRSTSEGMQTRLR